MKEEVKMKNLICVIMMVGVIFCHEQKECTKNETFHLCDEWIISFQDDVTNVEQRAKEITDKYDIPLYGVLDVGEGISYCC